MPVSNPKFPWRVNKLVDDDKYPPPKYPMEESAGPGPDMAALYNSVVKNYGIESDPTELIRSKMINKGEHSIYEPEDLEAIGKLIKVMGKGEWYR